MFCRMTVTGFAPRVRIIHACLTFWIGGMLAANCAAQMLDALARPQPGHSMRSTSTARNPDGSYAHGNSDNSRVAAGKTKVVLDAEGPGVVTHMWFTFLAPEPHPWAKEGSATHQEMLLRVFYDGQDKPSIEVPFGDFFANCFGRRSEVMSIPVVVEDADSYNCFWRMPFHKSMRIEIENQSSKAINLLYFNIDWIKLDTLAEDTPYFYAQYRQAYPTPPGDDYVMLETAGRGHYVGTVLSVRTRSPSWFGEGDEKIYIDGEQKASIWGTGTEDYFLSAWGLQRCSTLYFGTPYFDQWGIVGGHTSAYRWHIQDPIVFQRSIKATIEHWGWISTDENPDQKSDSWNEREDDYASVAFWYQQGTPSPAPPVPPASQRVLPELDKIIAAAPFADDKHHGPGNCSVQTNLGFYPAGQLFYQPRESEGAWMEIPFDVQEKRPCRLLLKITRAEDYGTYRATLNGVPIGQPMDCYSSSVSDWEWHLLDFWPEPGHYTLRLECVGKNARSTGYYLGIESVRLRERRPRVTQFAHEKDREWRTAPKLHE
jgi:hypothetical protein